MGLFNLIKYLKKYLLKGRIQEGEFVPDFAKLLKNLLWLIIVIIFEASFVNISRLIRKI